MFTFGSCALSIITRMANSNSMAIIYISMDRFFCGMQIKVLYGDDDEEVADDLLNKQ